MRVDLADLQRSEHHDRGEITGADGRAYARRSTRLGRRDADAMVAAGAPLVLELFGHGRFEWADGGDAVTLWQEVRASVVTSEPTAKQLSKHERFTAGIWEAGDGRRLLHLDGRC